MVKTKFKKAVSLMLAAVMSLTAFTGIGATTAFAAVGEKADVYLVDYPRSGDTNNNGEWGHGNLNYMNGWKGLSTKYTGLRAMGSYSGTQSPMIIAKSAFQLFEKRYGWNNPIRSVTVQAINLVPQDTPRQIDMFMDAAKQDKLERMEKCVEEIRRRFGKDSIRNGVLCQNLRLPPEKAEITMPTGMVG